MKYVTSIARMLSGVFSPLLMGTYGIMLVMWLSFLCYSVARAKVFVTLFTLVATCMVPVIVIFTLMRIGKVHDPGLNERSERTIPYLVTAVMYAATAVYYHTMANAPVWLVTFVGGGAVALIFVTIINLRWKISGHATGMGALVGLMYFLWGSGNCPTDVMWQFLAVVLIAGLVCTSRLILNRHTPAQVCAGFFLGLACVGIAPWLIA